MEVSHCVVFVSDCVVGNECFLIRKFFSVLSLMNEQYLY